MERKHTCYFSVKCRHCQAFLEELARSPIASSVQLVSVDPSPRRAPLPAFLKAVPTLVVSGETEPRTGAAVFNWLYEARVRATAPPAVVETATTEAAAGGGPIQPRDYSAAAPPPLQGSGGGASGPSAWHSAEMAAGSWSDEYSFLDDTFSIEKGQGLNRIERNFGLWGEEGPGPGPGASPGPGPGGPAAAAAKPTHTPSKKEQALLNAFEALQASRSTDTPKAPVRK